MRKIITSVILIVLIAGSAFSQVIQEKTGTSGETKGLKFLSAKLKDNPREYQLHGSTVILSSGTLKGAYYAHDKNSDICATIYFFENSKDSKAAVKTLTDYYKAAGYIARPESFVKDNLPKYQVKAAILDDPAKSGSVQWKEQKKNNVLVLEINGEITIIPSYMNSAADCRIMKK